ncbi:MAG: hypothetical protein QNK36_04935 [Colwellia sp.]|nr:hypothetical protein [Colwellia sp.]
MDGLTFTSNMISTLAWPITVIILFFILRSELPNIAKSIKKFKYKDVELEFGAAVKAVAKEAKGSLPPSKSNVIAGKTTEDIKTRLDAVAELAPRAAILESWIQVEAAAADVIQKKGLVSSVRYPGPTRLLTALKNEGILNGKQTLIFEQLRMLRNEAVHVHDAEFTVAAVASYIESAILIASYLEDIANGL